MNIKKLLSVEKTTDNKFLNLYIAKFKLEDNNIKNYQICSRKNKEDLVCLNENIKPDGVRILPYIKKDNKIYVCFIKEFRYALNRYIYSLPAGLIDKNEDPVTSAKRELEEEIGAEIVQIEKTENTSFTSAGMSDENLEIYEAEVIISKKQNLDFSEDITLELIELDDIPSFLSNNLMGMSSLLQARAFYYKTKYEELLKKAYITVIG